MEQTPITFKQFKERGELCEFCGEPTTIASRNKHKRGVICSCDWVDKKAEQYASKAQNNLIADIKDKVAKLEENTNTTDFALDVINLLKSIKPKQR